MKKLKRFFSTVSQGTCASLLACSLVLMGSSATAFAYATESSADHHHVTALAADECSLLGHSNDVTPGDIFANTPDSDHDTIVWICDRCGKEARRTVQVHNTATSYEAYDDAQHAVVRSCWNCSTTISTSYENHTGDGAYSFKPNGNGTHLRTDRCTKCSDYRKVNVNCTGDGSYRFKYRGNGTHLCASKCKYCNVRFNYTAVKCTYKKGTKVCKYCDNKKRWHK